MAIVYAVTKCKNPKYPDTDYLSCKARNTGTYDFDDLAERHRLVVKKNLKA